MWVSFSLNLFSELGFSEPIFEIRFFVCFLPFSADVYFLLSSVFASIVRAVKTMSERGSENVISC